MTNIGIVVIGRNEGERLRRCLEAVRTAATPCVYVDSGSSDGSVELAGAIVGASIRLDPSTPYTAARGRNEGFRYLMARYPELAFVQFVDGDCELDPGWIHRARRELLAKPSVAIVCGQLREAQPHASIYNLLCDIEWDRPAGVTAACGGIFMVRVDAFRGVSGFNSSIAAGEEPDLCLRLRRQGWTILRVNSPMAVHDAAMFRFGEWWKRAVRSGRCAMESLCRSSPRVELPALRRIVSIVLWTVGIPLATVAATWFMGTLGLIVLAAYPVQWVRLWWRHRRHLGRSARVSSIAATFTFIGKAAELFGLVQVLAHNLSGILRRGGRMKGYFQVERGGSHAQL